MRIQETQRLKFGPGGATPLREAAVHSSLFNPQIPMVFKPPLIMKIPRILLRNLLIAKCCHVCRKVKRFKYFSMHWICQQMTIVHLPQHPTVDPHFINQHGRDIATKLVYVPFPFS